MTVPDNNFRHGLIAIGLALIIACSADSGGAEPDKSSTGPVTDGEQTVVEKPCFDATRSFGFPPIPPPEYHELKEREDRAVADCGTNGECISDYLDSAEHHEYSDFMDGLVEAGAEVYRESFCFTPLSILIQDNLALSEYGYSCSSDVECGKFNLLCDTYVSATTDCVTPISDFLDAAELIPAICTMLGADQPCAPTCSEGRCICGEEAELIEHVNNDPEVYAELCTGPINYR